MSSLPSRTVTFVFTDIEGSTRLLQQLGEHYAALLADHHRLLRAAFQELGGLEVQDHGDGLYYTFSSAKAALEAVVAAQRAVLAHAWPDGASVRVRMGLHTGEPIGGETGLVGIDIHRAARICAAGHGGQILVSEATRALVALDLPETMSLRDLGEHRLKDLARPLRLFQAAVPGLLADFPPLKSLSVLPNNLPVQLTSFVGREQERAEVQRLLATTHLLTLTGAGGAGKTRLSLQVAADVFEEFRDGIWLLELASLSDSALIPHMAMSTLGVKEEPNRSLIDTLTDFLRPKSLLLILDNCEHLLGGCGELANTLLRTCPHLRILAPRVL